MGGRSLGNFGDVVTACGKKLANQVDRLYFCIFGFLYICIFVLYYYIFIFIYLYLYFVFIFVFVFVFFYTFTPCLPSDSVWQGRADLLKVQPCVDFTPLCIDRRQ